jgi:integrase
MNIGLLILFKSGLRIGELAALKCEDISNNIIHVHRTEICYEENNKRIFEVRDFPKTEAGIRNVIIPDKYVDYLKKVCSNSSGDFLFEICGKRIMTYQFRNRLRTVCKRTNVVCKSPHKIRKTYASMLIDEGVSESIVISQMGHTDIRTTKGFYYKNRNGDKTRIDVINSVKNL